MPITIKTGTLKYKKSDGTYNGFNAIAQESTDQQLADIYAAGTAEVGAVTAKGEEVLESIPEDYTELAGDVSELKSALTFKISKGYSTEQIQFVVSKGKIIDATGAEVSSSNFAIIEADLTGISGYLRILSYIGSGNARYAFYDANDNVIDIKTESGSAASISVEDIKIPENAAKVKVTGFKINLFRFPRVCKIKYEEEITNSNGGDFTDLLVPNNFEDIEYSWTSGGYYYTNNSFVESDAHFMVISVASGEYYRITGKSYYSNNIIGFISDTNDITWFPNASNAKRYDEIINIPKKVIALIVQGKSSEVTTIKKASGYANGRIFLGKKIAIIGDSTIEENANSSMKWHNIISSETGLDVVNLGVSGSGYKKKDTENKAYYQRITDIPNDCDAVVIFGSGNDNTLAIGETNDNTTDTVCGCINETINGIISLYPTQKIGVITAYPWASYKPNTENAMQTIANDIVKICRNNSIPVLDLYHCSNLRPWVSANNSALFYNADGVHVNNDGHAILAPIILEFLKKLLSSY